MLVDLRCCPTSIGEIDNLTCFSDLTTTQPPMIWWSVTTSDSSSSFFEEGSNIIQLDTWVQNAYLVNNCAELSFEFTEPQGFFFIQHRTEASFRRNYLTSIPESYINHEGFVYDRIVYALHTHLSHTSTPLSIFHFKWAVVFQASLITYDVTKLKNDDQKE